MIPFRSGYRTSGINWADAAIMLARNTEIREGRHIAVVYGARQFVPQPQGAR